MVELHDSEYISEVTADGVTDHQHPQSKFLFVRHSAYTETAVYWQVVFPDGSASMRSVRIPIVCFILSLSSVVFAQNSTLVTRAARTGVPSDSTGQDTFGAFSVGTRVPIIIGDGKGANVLAAGAQCDWNGTTGTDDSTVLQTALNAGGGVIFPDGLLCRSTTTLNVRVSGTTIRGSGGVQFTARNQPGFVVTANATFENGVKVIGPQNSTSQQNEAGIYIQGASAASPIAQVTIKDGVEVYNWGMYGVVAQHVTRFDVSKAKLHDVIYAGFMTASVMSGSITDSEIWNIQTGGSSYDGEAYGISLNRASTPSAVTDPPTQNFIVARNRVHDVAAWECMDTHSGINIAFEKNHGWNCPRGIVVTDSTDGSGNEMLAPKKVLVTGNTLNSGVSDGSAAYGIAFTGVSSGSPLVTTDAATGTVSGNYLYGYGHQATNNSGGFYFHDTSGLVLSGNTCQECSPSAVQWYYNNVGFTESGNIYIDFWTNTIGARYATGTRAGSFNNIGTVVGNSYVRGSKSATYILEQAISAGSYSPPNLLTIGTNQNQAATYIDAPDGVAVGPCVSILGLPTGKSSP